MAKEKTINEFIDKNRYVLKWLSAGPEDNTEPREQDFDKRFESVLTALHKEADPNVIRLKPRKKQ